ncbi:MAG: tail fiber domain-containing protein [Casimicrobium sp.]
MKTRFTALLNVFALFCALGFASVHAQVPKTINYQGYLTTPSGAAVNSNVMMRLKLYDAVTGGTALHDETQSVSVANGVFNVLLGYGAPLTLPFTKQYFLGVTVEPDTAEMTPRRPLSAAPYAVTAENIAPGGNLYLSGSTATLGNVFKNGNRFMHNYGVLNTFLGEKAGNFTLTSQQNTAVGQEALSAVTTGGANTAIGFSAAAAVTAGASNTAIGNDALRVSLSGQNNTAVGGSALYNATSNENIGLGAGAGFNLTTGGGNIMIGNQGVAAESDTIRLGTPGSHTRTFLSGTVNTAAIAATGAITTASTLSATTVVAPKIGANTLPAAVDRPITIQADTSSSGSEWISFKNGTGATKWHLNNLSGGINFAETGQSDARLFLAAGGNVGIGTALPTKAKLEITGFATQAFLSTYIVASTGGFASAGSSADLSLYASKGVAAEYFVAFSDQRIKRITGRSNAARDLATLAAIEITDYTHIDTPQRGDKAHKKVIAQQVETVFPQAVNKITDVVPDIYQRAAVKDGWIALEDPTKANLKNGDRVRLIGKATQGVHEVLEVADGRFRTAFKADADTIFVYGREVNDFRTVDYEAIAMLNVSATQELHRRLDAEAAKVRAQGAEIAQLKQQLAQLSDLNAKVAWLMAQKALAKP